MAGRPPKSQDEKKVREAIYFEPHLLNWLRDEADREKCTVSVIVNRMVEATKASQK